MASISTIKQAVMICRKAQVTPFIWGNRGLGKSSLVQQLAVENGWGFIDLRCSQLEASDLRGLPDRGEDQRTHYLPPADMPVGDMTMEQIAEKLGKLPKEGDLEAERVYYAKLQELQAHFQCGILFLDEFNRAQDDVLQAGFQLILDRRIGQYALPPGWCVVAAGNFMEGEYKVTGFTDPAFLNRFCHLTLSEGETTLEEWVNYMSSIHGPNATDVIEFASQNVKHLDGDVNGELGFKISPSRRSWEMVVKVQKACGEADIHPQARMEVLAGLIGRELAQSFARYSCPVKPRELLRDGVKAHEKELKKLDRNPLTGLMWGLVSFCKNQIDKEDVAAVCLDFAEFMVKQAKDKDVVVAFCRALVRGDGTDANSNQERARAAVISNPRLATMIANFRKKSGNTTKTFIDRLAERPQLQEALSRVSWGISDEDKE